MLLYLNIWFLGFGCDRNEEKEKAVRKLIEKNCADLGKISQEEIIVLVSFVLLILLWFFRDPGFIPGWASLFPKPEFTSDGMPGKNILDLSSNICLLKILI